MNVIVHRHFVIVSVKKWVMPFGQKSVALPPDLQNSNLSPTVVDRRGVSFCRSTFISVIVLLPEM
jgi:hypothetical protein